MRNLIVLHSIFERPRESGDVTLQNGVKANTEFPKRLVLVL